MVLKGLSDAGDTRVLMNEDKHVRQLRKQLQGAAHGLARRCALHASPAGTQAALARAQAVLARILDADPADCVRPDWAREWPEPQQTRLEAEADALASPSMLPPAVAVVAASPSPAGGAGAMAGRAPTPLQGGLTTRTKS